KTRRPENHSRSRSWFLLSESAGQRGPGPASDVGFSEYVPAAELRVSGLSRFAACVRIFRRGSAHLRTVFRCAGGAGENGRVPHARSPADQSGAANVAGILAARYQEHALL